MEAQSQKISGWFIIYCFRPFNSQSPFTLPAKEFVFGFNDVKISDFSASALLLLHGCRFKRMFKTLELRAFFLFGV